MREGRFGAHETWLRHVRSTLVCLSVAFLAVACGSSSGGGASASASGSIGAAASASGSIAASGGGPSASPGGSGASAAASAASSAAATAKPVASVKGTGFVDSKTFQLAAGNYLVRWTITAKDATGCGAIGAIHSPDGGVSVEVANTKLTAKGTKSGAKAAPKLAGGSYLVTFATTCTWTAQVYRA